MKIRATILIAAVITAVSGCAVCERHPLACGAGAVLLAGSLAAGQGGGSASARPPRMSIQPVRCTGALCQ
jgi:hypothetical protein